VRTVQQIECIFIFYILLTVLSNIMIYQLDAQILYFNNLLHSFTCFEHYSARLQKDNCMKTATGIVSLFR